MAAVAAWRPAQAGPALWAAFLAERDRWALWLPVLFGAGIGVYFVLPLEPAWWIAPAVATAGLGLALLRAEARLVGVPLLLFGAGLALAQWQSHAVAGPVLERRIGPVAVTGLVEAAERTEQGIRLVLAQPAIARLPADQTPLRVRVSWRGGGDLPRPGQWVTLRAVLNPPAGPAAPGAFDFARQAWFQGIGGVGFAVGPPQVVEGRGAAGGFRLWLSDLRQGLTARIHAALPGAVGAVAAALMTGDRAAIPAEVNDAYRDSGLAHLLSISGLHLALAAGFIFAAVRGGLALWPAVALRWNIKKAAAVTALAGTFAYMLLAGAEVPVQRAFAMTGLVLLAMLVDRQALSMRGVALAAFAILLVAPQAILNAGFHMSFAAVIALIATWEAFGRRLQPAAEAGWLRRALLWFVGALATSVIAGAATAPFAAFHFNRFVDLGIVSNLVAVPLASFWVMPWAVAAFVLMPLGLEHWALIPMGWGVAGINAVALQVAAWPEAVRLIPAMPGWALPAFALGGLWLCLWQRAWRWAGLAPIALAAASPAWVAPPQVWIHPEGAVAVRGDGPVVAQGRGFVVDTWLRRVGETQALAWPRAGPAADGALRCDAQGCTFRHNNWLVALPRQAAALHEDCRTADVVVTTLSVRGRCPSARVVIDRAALQAGGAHTLVLPVRGPPTVAHANSLRGQRPWSVRP